jgi:site-specific DNA-adenine methylase|tara:strand:+ start:2909 stop:3316 length:408 start_codon:yes stop_codon:yes gene_type:complete
MQNKNAHNESVGSEIVRSNNRIDETGEVFTPMKLCAEMVSEIPQSVLQDAKSTFIDPSAGSGNFLLALQTELLKYHELSHINDNMLYGIELMEDNHAEMCKRLGVAVDHPHFVCADATKYDYSFGQPQGLDQFWM